ncbi:di-trans,poly-cis-decaprenylcistransferase [Candidatus Pantoea edessiphila]|uniref:Ditrans,polycis-undecaprenyl-diphosphate synthase ((2E,6E)-farnesyl-diphosphate specific) n=1 Tax=Candidatus Pantoea edessiphila TaxID=2044610 RepID=A0A2P5SXZ1_9GAMM|nr:polyprenyl diphosphate synthase [Candidatus Pantoea edessiphila]MBK4775564.1 di-trans,poly-cis-decaprenylcistransferase [Pantoea sp. Edef]PPI87217.1 di-trans,poly-cis-decaprenylcistransferase [Candidatus Pantoea edessiphila]
MSFDNKIHNDQINNPYHIAIIMDGNGRWALNKGRSRIYGHKAGVESVKRSIRFALNHNIRVLTLYTFSRDNWNRPKQEVNDLIELFISSLEIEVENLHRHGICLCIIGDVVFFNKIIQDRIKYAEMLTKNNNKLILNIAINYDGRWDITESAKKIAKKVKNGLLSPEHITEDSLTSHLTTSNLPEVDLLIRTGGEYRISNFLLWQLAYAEFYFTNILWPDFDEHIFDIALKEFYLRERRYGRLLPDTTK